MKKRRRKKLNKRIFILAGIAALLILVICVICSSGDDATGADFSVVSERDIYEDDTLISEGIYIGGQYVGGMTKAEARQLLENLYTTSENRTVIIKWEDMQATTSLEELGVTWGINKAINRAITLVRKGGLLGTYKTTQELKNCSYQIELSRSLDKELVKSFIEDNFASVYDTPYTNATITRRDGQFVISAEKIGRKTDIDSSVGAVLSAFYNSDKTGDIVANCVIKDDEPELTAAMLSDISDRLGTYTTTYLANDGRERTERCTNVEVATSYISGTVLLPGQQASTSELMKERTVENGYATGGQYVNGQLEDAIGGGVCQVASTLYNALLRAELQIDERSNHSLLVSYVEPSFDAAIATGSKDLVFTNNLDKPIFIYGYTDGHNVTFSIYGTEYRDASHTVAFENVIEKRITSEDIIITSDDMYTDERRQVGLTHDECWSHLEKITYENGVEVSRETLHSDYYMPSQAKIYVGTKERPTEAATEAATEVAAQTTTSASSGN